PTRRLPDRSSLFPYTTLFRSIGKIVFIPPPVHEPADEAGWTVVTGGTGAMGSATVQWLLEQGERRIAVWARRAPDEAAADALQEDRKSTRLNSSHVKISYAVF